MSMKKGDVVRITCPVSKYDGVEGEVFRVQKSSRYAIVDMPEGTEQRAEGILENKIIARMRQSEKKRKTPIKEWPKGDPQWFPFEWLTVLREGTESVSEEPESPTDD